MRRGLVAAALALTAICCGLSVAGWSMVTVTLLSHL